MLDRKELILEGLAYTVMGMIVVFAILIIIMLVIKAMALFSTDGKESRKELSAPQAPAPAVKEVKEESAPEKKADDSVIIAVITAAIAAMLGNSTAGFRIRSYKKVSDGAWNKAGRREVLDNRI